MLTIVSFVFVLGILIFIHELGHFLVAKRVGIFVEKFSLGFPPNIFSKKVGDTTYCIGIIPLGGYVKMAGENPAEEGTGAENEFMSKSVGQRAAVIFAGPFMNYFLSIFLLICFFYFGGRPLYDDSRILVGDVTEDGPAFKAGLQEDDTIIALDGRPVSSFDSLRTEINSRLEVPVSVTWVRNADTTTVEMTTDVSVVPSADGDVDSVGIIGFYQKPIGYEKFGLVESVSKGFVAAHVIVFETVKFVKSFLTGQVSPRMIGGPVFIAQQSGKEAAKGVTNLIFFMALLSVNLAVLNVLPVPVLDGGHLVFLLIELVKGSPLSMKTRAVAQQAGMVLLLALIVMVTYNDIMRLFTGF